MLAFVVALTAVVAVDPPLPDAEVKALERRFDDEIAAATKVIEKDSTDVSAFSARGDANFFRGRFAEAVKDFDRMIELKPSLEAGHWRRGLALYYAGRYADSAKQFALYHSYDNVDRENGVWKYFAQVKSESADKAKKDLLIYRRFDREPFPDVYAMLEGKKKPAEVLDRINRETTEGRERDQRLFFGEMYVGIYLDIHGDPKAALPHLVAAVKNPWAKNAEQGAGWMWQVARIHEIDLRQRLKSTEAAPPQRK